MVKTNNQKFSLLIISFLEPSKTTNHLRWRKDQTHWRQANAERYKF